MKRALLKTILVLVGLLGLAMPAWAHGVIARADPPVGGAVAGSPEVVRLWFTEPIDPAFSGIEVRSAATQERVDLGAARLGADGALTTSLQPGLMQGAYIVSWRAFTPSDGHQTSGSYLFGVGVPAAGAQTLSTERTLLGDTVRFLWLSGLVLFTGVAVFRWAIWPGDESGLGRSLFWPVQYVRVALGLGLLGSLYVQAQALEAGVVETLGTQWGAAWLLRAAMTGVVLARTHWLMRSQAYTAGVVAGGFLVFTTAVISHSAARFGWLGVLVDGLHLLAAGVWSGGVLCAALLIRAGQRKFLPNFSILATAAVGLLAVTGVWLGSGQVGSWPGLLFTEYGRALLLKLAAVAAAFGLGAVNALRPGRVASALEVGAGLAVLLAAAILTNLPPAYAQVADSAPARLAQASSAGRLKATLTLWPARLGANTFEVQVERGGAPVAGANVRAQFVPVDTQPAGSAVIGHAQFDEIGGGLYSASSAGFTNRGDWQVLVALDEAEFLKFDFSIGPDGAVRSPDDRPGPAVALAGWLNRYALAFGAGLLLLGAAGWSGLAWRSLRSASGGRGAWAMWLAPGLLGAGAVWLWIKLLF